MSGRQALIDELRSAVRAELQSAVEMSSQRWLSLEQAVKYSGLGRESLRQLLNARKLTPHYPNRRLLIDRYEIDSYISSTAMRGFVPLGRPKKAKGR